MDSRKYGDLSHMDSRAKFYRIVFEESVTVKGVPFSLVQIAPPDAARKKQEGETQPALPPASFLLVRADLNCLRVSAEMHFCDSIVVEHYFGGLGSIGKLNPLDWNVGHEFAFLNHLKFGSIVLDL